MDRARSWAWALGGVVLLLAACSTEPDLLAPVAPPPSGPPRSTAVPERRRAEAAAPAEAVVAESPPVAVPPAPASGVRLRLAEPLRPRDSMVAVVGVTQRRGVSHFDPAEETREVLDVAPGLAVVVLRGDIRWPDEGPSSVPNTVVAHLVRVPADLELRVPPAPRLRGRVVDADGLAVAGLDVSAWHPVLYVTRDGAQTKADGTFELDLPGHGPVDVRARGTGWVAGATHAADPAAGPVEIRVRRGATIAGRVPPPAGGWERRRPLFAYAASRDAGDSAYAKIPGDSAADSFEVGPLVPGSYDLWVGIGTAPDRFRSPATEWAYLQDVRPGTRVAEPVRQPPRALRIRVTGDGGANWHPWMCLSVSVEGTVPGGALSLEGEREGDRIVFPSLPPGRLVVRAGGDSFPFHAEPVVVEPDVAGDLELPVRPTEKLRGRLVDETGQPVVAGWIAAVPDPDRMSSRFVVGWAASVEVGPDGRFELDRVIPGRRRLVWYVFDGWQGSGPVYEAELGEVEVPSAGDVTLTLRVPTGPPQVGASR